MEYSECSVKLKCVAYKYATVMFQSFYSIVRVYSAKYIIAILERLLF